MAEAKVKSYTRKTKSGKTVQVRAHSRKCEGGSCADKKGAGIEYSDALKKRYMKGYLSRAAKAGVSEELLNKMHEHSNRMFDASTRLSDGRAGSKKYHESAKKKQTKFYNSLTDAQKKFYKKHHGYTE